LVLTLPAPEEHPPYLEHILGLTGFAAGAVDIISFAKLGGVFASAMTGNLAFLGLYIARLSFASAIGSAIALLGFVAGAAVGHLLTRGKDRGVSLQTLLSIETALLAAACILWLPTRHANGSLAADALIALLSVSMGLQSIVGKKINLSNIPTVVFTSTLTNLVIGITDTIVYKKSELPADTKRQIKSFLLYFAGALCAGFLVFLNLELLVALPLFATGAALMIQRKNRDQ
jgi:uncharacterized membrane protein YoaK (UPF0700 family)